MFFLLVILMYKYHKLKQWTLGILIFLNLFFDFNIQSASYLLSKLSEPHQHLFFPARTLLSLIYYLVEFIHLCVHGLGANQ